MNRSIFNKLSNQNNKLIVINNDFYTVIIEKKNYAFYQSQKHKPESVFEQIKLTA